MGAIQIFNYNNANITFHNNEGVAFVNATEIAKAFGKQPVHWLNQTSTNEYLTELSKLRNRSLAELVKVTKGGNNPGTWMHEDVALEFSRWLSPAFAIWCNDRIKELLRHGMTATAPTLEAMLQNPDIIIGMATELKKEREAKAALETTVQMQSQTISLQTAEIQAVKPKAEYFDTVLQSRSTYLADQVAKEMGMTAVTMNKRLKEKGILMKRGTQWVLTAKYAGNQYTNTKTHTYTDSNTGQQCTNATTVWTEKGRKFLHDIFKPENNN